MSSGYPDGVNQAEFDRSNKETDGWVRCVKCDRFCYEEDLALGLCDDCFEPPTVLGTV